MEWLIVISLLAFGLGLIVLELIFIPGTTLVGLLGLACTGYGVYLSYDYFGNTVGSSVLTGVVLVTLGTVYTSLKSGVWERFSLKDTITSKVNDEMELPIIGDIGVAASALRPYGTCNFNGSIREVQSFGGFVDAGRKVRVIRVEHTRVVVEQAKELEN